MLEIAEVAEPPEEDQGNRRMIENSHQVVRLENEKGKKESGMHGFSEENKLNLP